MPAALSPHRRATVVSEADTSHEIFTFLFTDIVDSTWLWDLDPVAMSGAIDQHDAILRRTFDRHFGFVVTAIGDGFCAAFFEPAQAVQAAIEGLRQLSHQEWATARPLAVRMAIHTGDAERKGESYAGPQLNRTARILKLAHGDEILVSHTTRNSVDLDGQVEFIDLGDHRLRGLRRSEHIYRLKVLSA